ncbi:LysR family transcriptional regulator [Lichenifustis flavocetrariae]|uniref:LysR family transcriptional regulator n=1 Tax=Lichenifustis flavocetrariae TaxID=2949735 RepID=A0AA41YV74_9HYPH|nr:LysR family transcriptional regulator [Lichenifustis flavocetrariae]MCW6509194.1 LysR family transcriptional regulator [Lichenifustis flavocetrariae]
MQAKAQVDSDRARALEVFRAVIEAGSFSGAARALDLTPSAVSRTVDRIEARLGVRLLIRTTRLLTLTAEGQAYLAAARRILNDLDDTEQTIADQGAPRGRLRVSASLSHGRLCVVPLLGDFARRYPHILIDFNLTDEVVDIAGGQADVGIRFGQLADSGLVARKLGTSRRMIVAAPGYLARHGTPMVPRDLEQHNCLNFNFRRSEPIWPFQFEGRGLVLGVRGSIEANNGETLGQLALAGVGITRVGAFSVADDLAAGRLVSLLEEFNPGDVEEIHAVFVGGLNLPARIRVFVDFLAEKLSAAMPT